MPRMDGLMLLQEVRHRHPDIPYPAHAYSEFDYAMQALKLGVENYLMKPMQIQELTETIENALDNVYIKRENREALFKENILRRWYPVPFPLMNWVKRTIFLDIIISPHRSILLCHYEKEILLSPSELSARNVSKASHLIECTTVWIMLDTI